MAKAQSDLEKEVAQLRRQVAELKTARTTPSVAVDEGESGDEGGLIVQVREGAQDFTDQLEELVENLKREINETPTASCLAIFALGLLMGRALAR